jgi:hypothetical protein
MSRSGGEFLERKRIFIPRRARAKLQVGAAKSHFRPVRPHPELLGPDDVATRVLTQSEQDRVAYTDKNPND